MAAAQAVSEFVYTEEKPFDGMTKEIVVKSKALVYSILSVF